MPNDSSKKFPPWSVAIAIILVVAIFFGASIVGEIVVVLYGLANGVTLSGIDKWVTSSTAAQFINTVLVYGLMATILVAFLKGYKTSLSALGFIKPRLRDIGVMLLGIMPYIIGYAILLGVATQIFPSINIDQEQELGFKPTTSVVGLIITFISLVVIPPIVEELLMRGFLFTSLLGRVKVWLAVLITSIVFAAAHLQWGNGAPLLWVAAIDTFMLSVVLCVMRYKTGSLWPGIFLHALKNGVAFLSIFVLHLK